VITSLSMKRRQAIQAILGTPVLTALPTASAAPPAPQTPRAASDMPKLTTTQAEAAADPERKFLTVQQLATLRRLGELFVPSGENRPGATDARATEFLDFLLAQSPHSRQVLYSNGLDRLQLESGRRFNHRFEDLTAEQAGSFMEALRTPLNRTGYLGEFLWTAREDLLAATLNSREHAEAQAAAGRRAVGVGTYWYPIE
jgi:Gluconate 2-dehydrogenase subunit 3